MQPEIEKIEDEIETAIGRLRKAEAYQAEYDNMSALLNMLMQDRMHLLKTHKVKP